MQLLAPQFWNPGCVSTAMVSLVILVENAYHESPPAAYLCLASQAFF